MSGVDRNDKRFFDFMCSCGDKGKARCDEVYDDVMAEFNRDVASYTRLDRVTDGDFMTFLVHKLDYMKNGQANIEHIYTDMWSGIAVNYEYDYDENRCECGKGADHDECECSEWKVQKFWVECDQIHHGLARAYQLVRDFDADKELSERRDDSGKPARKGSEG